MKKSVLLAGIGALAYYIYTRLDEQQKEKLVTSVKDHLNKTIEQFMPRNSRANYETKLDNAVNGRLGENDFTE